MIVVWILLAAVMITTVINVRRDSKYKGEFGMIERRNRALAAMKKWKEH